VFEDVKRLIAIRKQESDVFAAVPNYVSKNMRRLTYQSDRPCPAPYIRWNDEKAIVVAGNLETESSLSLALEIPLTAMNLAGHKRYRVTDLWTERSFEAQAATLARLECTVERDKTPGGGMRLLKIEPA
jgi:hypothetical protein